MKVCKFIRCSAIVALVMLSACSTHMGNIGHISGNSIKLSKNNFKVVATLSGRASAEYVLGIGPSEQKLFDTARTDMQRKADLLGKSKVIVNLTTDSKVRYFFPFWCEKTLYVSGEVIEFEDIKKVDKTSKDALSKANDDRAKALKLLEDANKRSLDTQKEKNRILAELREELEKVKAERDSYLNAKKQAQIEKNKALDGKRRALKERDDCLKGKEAALAELSKFGNIKKEKRGLVLTLSDILFDFAKASLRLSSKNELKKIAKTLNKVSDRKILVEGHTDSVGGVKFNKILSGNRAKSVMNFLILNGVKKERLKFKGFGMKKPVASNKTREGRQKNRRVNIVILK